MVSNNSLMFKKSIEKPRRISFWLVNLDVRANRCPRLFISKIEIHMETMREPWNLGILKDDEAPISHWAYQTCPGAAKGKNGRSGIDVDYRDPLWNLQSQRHPQPAVETKRHRDEACWNRAIWCRADNLWASPASPYSLCHGELTLLRTNNNHIYSVK